MNSKMTSELATLLLEEKVYQEKENTVFPRSILIANRNEITDINLDIEGCLPQDLKGHIYIMGPAGAVDSPLLPNHEKFVLPVHGNGISIFNGDGMICRISFDDDQNASATTRLVKTPCFYLDQQLNQDSKFPMDFGFQSVGLMRFSPRLGMRTHGNTACFPLQFANDPYPRLLLTSDNGRPYEIDPETLEILTPIGWNHEWKDIKMPIASGPFKMVGSAAHPVFDQQTNEFFTVNWSKSMASMLSPLHLSMERLEQLLEKLPKFIRIKYWKIKILLFINQIPACKDLIPLFQEALFDDEEIVNFFKPYVSPNLLEALQAVEQELLLRPMREVSTLLKFMLSSLGEAISLFHKTKAMEDFVHLVRWNGGHALESWKILVKTEHGSEPMRLKNSLHQVGITEDYLVLMDTSFKVGINQVFGRNFPGWEYLLSILRDKISHAQSPTSHVYIIHRSDLTDENIGGQSKDPEKTIFAKRITLPQEVAHFAVDYRNSKDQITLHVAHNCAWDPAEWVQPYDQLFGNDASPVHGFSTGSMDLNKLGKYILDVKEERILECQLTSDPDLTWATAIYTHSPYLKDGKIDTIFWNSWGVWDELKTQFITELYRNYSLRDMPLAEVLNKTVPANIVRLNTKSMEIEGFYQFPDGYFGNSPQFIPRSGNGTEGTETQDGYIVSVVTNDSRQLTAGTELWIFSASQLSNGPICKLSHPKFKLGITIHSAWMSAAKSYKSSYRVPIREDYESLLQQEPTVIRNLFEEYVFPEF